MNNNNCDFPGEKSGRTIAAPRTNNEMIPRIRLLRWVAGFSIAAFLYFLSLGNQSPNGSFFARLRPCDHTLGESAAKGGEKVAEKPLVPLEAHIMSKCPDAQDCLKLLVLPTMQRVLPKVNFTLSFIGTPTANDGVSCMHGPPECLGNIIELCAADLYPSPKTYLGFTMCLTRDYPSIPEKSLVADCALEHGIDMKKLEECAVEDDGGKGMSLLRNSVKRSADNGVTKSCTVRLDNEIYCVRDGREWKDCPHGAEVNDLVLAIEKKYRDS
ncbi:hypothetical protein HYFRA_00006189 [Hymenoscyphus fraxineus]|uniref:Gamma interferon inducible lysosomal thiol reductase n=1 Tax=Hymenoscyphus fraxineus TaxID=746836 RepID=A0A9N9LCF6_9HELO|nr:hypothetical protein HYFRA_00006189 [Hymenoscyphus fraxineus]